MIEIGKDNYIPCGANDVWRFFAAFDPSVDIYICRDLDSHLDNPRDLPNTLTSSLKNSFKGSIIFKFILLGKPPTL